MKNIRLIVFLLFSFLVSFLLFADNQYPFMDKKLSIEERVEDLVSRMTLEEKVSQMVSNASAIKRLGIPAYNWENECLHGVGKLAEYKVTVFPQPIGMAASWDKDLLYDVADCISNEGRAVYHDAIKRGITKNFYGITYWAPNINIFRDPRWGRGHETYGEDPYLTSSLGKSFVKGLQGNDPFYLKTSACVKHYAVHSGPETSRHEFNTEVSNYDLWDTYLSAFRDLIVDAKASGVMCAYNAYSGKPCCGNDKLMMDILRNKWGFKGYVTSDCGAIDDFYKYHKTHPDTISAAVDAVLHGTDLDCIRDVTFKTLVRAVRENRIKEIEIDKAVKRLFTIRFRLGMFDEELNKKFALPLSTLDSEKNKKLALKMSHESIVLLKNEKNLLPLSKNIKRIAVVGPNANNDLGLLGNYHGYPSKIVTILDGIKNKVSSNTEVYYEKMIEHLDVDDFIPLDFDQEISYNGEKGYYVEYYNNSKFNGNSIKKYKENIEIHYRGEMNIVENIKSSEFAIKCITEFKPKKSGRYTLNLDTDKRFAINIDGKTCIDARTGKAKSNGKYTQYFEAGKTYKIEFEVAFRGRHGDMSFKIGYTKRPSFRELASRVQDYDAIVFVGGISPALEGEQNGVMSEGFKDGDRTTINLPLVQTELMKELIKTGKPVVFIMMTGSALAINWENENIPAILNVWYPGQSGGTAVADVLFGDYNPGGRLPITFYKKDSDLPDFTNYSMEGRTYRYFKGDVLYPFGYGLSYTSFKYKNLNIKSNISTTDTLLVTVDIINDGKYKGDEVPQLYISHIDKEEYLPIRALKGFSRISLLPGETKRVTFKLLPRDLATYNDFSECSVRAGKIKICVGGGQPFKRGDVLEKEIQIVGETNILPF